MRTEQEKLPVMHVAAMPDEAGAQHCSRCGLELHSAGAAPPPWYPGQLVAANGFGRWSCRGLPDGWPECTMARNGSDGRH